jgi:hypothetical protein
MRVGVVAPRQALVAVAAGAGNFACGKTFIPAASVSYRPLRAVTLGGLCDHVIAVQ